MILNLTGFTGVSPPVESPPPAAAAPEKTSDPTISGTARVGAILTCTPGAYTGAPTPEVTRQWKSAATSGGSLTDISGATGINYTQVSGDLTKYIKCVETAENTEGSVTGTSNEKGPVDVALEVGDSFVDFTITSETGGSSLPFAFLHSFKEGDVPTGNHVVSTDAVALQSEIRTTWSDGSACTVLLSGLATCTADVPKVLSLAAGADPGGADVALADLQALIVNDHNTVAVGAYGTVDLFDLVSATSTGYGSAGLVRSILGPVMSEFHFYSPVGADTHLSVWFYCRLWSNDALEIEVYVENGWLLVTAPETKSYTATVTINNAVAYTSSALTHLHHTRWGMPFWFSTDPGMRPAHDTAYLRLTKMVPNYGWNSPSASVYSGFTTTNTPFDIGDWPVSMGAAGGNGAPLEHWDAAYCQEADPIAFDACIVNAYMGGRYCLHYRDENTMRPVILADHVTLGINASNHGLDNVGISAVATPTPTGTGLPVFAKSHQRTMGYLAYLLTGRWGFLEQVQFHAMINPLACVPSGTGSRQGSSGILRGDVGAMQLRGMGWAQAAYARALGVTPESDIDMLANFKSMVEANLDYYHTNYIGLNNLGLTRMYTDYELVPNGGAGGDYFKTTAWQHHFVLYAFALMRDIGTHRLSAGHQTKLTNLVQWLGRLPVGMLGSQSAAEYCFTAAGQYSMRIGDGAGNPSNEANWNTRLYADYGDVWEATFGSPNTSCAEGSALTGTSGGVPSGMSGPSQYNYWLILHHAIAAAVDHGTPGAAEAYARLIGASNYASSTTTTADVPIYAIVPRSV